MLDERERRKDNFDLVNSVAVAFADGQVFYVPKPWQELRPVFKDGKTVSNYHVFTYGPEMDAILEIEAQSETLSEQMVGVASMAAYLLQWHYDLADAELDQLLAYRVGDAASKEWFDRVMEIATGQSGPKVRRAGGD